jgi:hypothetical protein
MARTSPQRSLRTPAAILASAVIVALLAAAALASSATRPASRAEHAALISAFSAQDGNASEVRSVNISRSNSALAVLCVHTPEGGPEAAVFRRSGRSWRLSSAGRPGASGNAAERRLERVC